MSDDFVDKVIHDTVVRNVQGQFQTELALNRAKSEMLARILAVHGLATLLVEVKGMGTFLCLDIERLSPSQVQGIEEIVMALAPPMDEGTAEAIAFHGMEGADEAPGDKSRGQCKSDHLYDRKCHCSLFDCSQDGCANREHRHSNNRCNNDSKSDNDT